MATNKKRREDALGAIDAMQDHFDQFRFRYDENDEDAKLEAVRSIMENLSEAENQLNQGNYRNCVNSLEGLRVVSQALEREADDFRFLEDPVVIEYFPEAIALAEILDQSD